ncbi:hypothetical protein PVAND_010880 [Polypedilum vanderplanki]|uniref:Uncharacterized protein n=1 Tax=Polypedilum vanderplanki TaxID=319348 RepID=A0A9J6CHC2_POLVA|nr:hypothetical protein PVAND_010880 [Polypedilum vanderplanki]
MYKKNTKKHPVYLVPEVKIEIFEDIPRLHVQLVALDMKNGRTLANRTIDFCDIDDYINANVFFKSLLHHLLENLKFILKCPFKMGKYTIKEHHMPNYVVVGLMQKGDKYLNIQKVKTRIDNHVKTIFESSYTTEVCEYD